MSEIVKIENDNYQIQVTTILEKIYRFKGRLKCLGNLL